MTVTILVPETATSADINLDVDIDASDSSALVISHNGTTLPETDSLLVECLVGQEVKLSVTDFTDSMGTSWSLSAGPLVRATGSGTTWQRDRDDVVDSDDIAWPHGSDYVEVEVEGSANSGTTIRTKKIRVKLLTSNPGPGTLDG